MKRKLLITFFFLCFSAGLYSRNIRIGIYASSSLYNVLLKIRGEAYQVICGGKKISSLSENAFLSLSGKDNNVVVSLEGTELGRFPTLRLERQAPGGSFHVRPLDNGAKDTWFEGNLEVVAHDDKLVLINEAGLEEYVTGVIEAEVGMHSHKEFLKVQAIICRTYAVSNYNRHRKEGYDLCDLVHCQVYRGKSRRNPNAVIAVQRTSGKVVADHQNKPIISAFHSNCGGQTINSEDMWPAPMPYLRSVRDSFCLSSPNCRWQAKIPAKSWTKYVGTYDSVGILKADTVRDYSHDMPFKTQLYNYKGVSIPFKKVRTDWNLKSCFFSIRQENDTLFLSGKGYGHGIGLCQEGAMRMAALGYAYQDIINFYYQNVRIISLSELLKQ